MFNPNIDIERDAYLFRPAQWPDDPRFLMNEFVTKFKKT